MMDDDAVTDADGYQATYDSMLSGVKSAFRSTFPRSFGLTVAFRQSWAPEKKVTVLDWPHFTMSKQTTI